MKFANIKYTKRNGRLTIGDDIQLLAIESMYRQIGVDYDEVVRIEFCELSSYDGEYVILPISFPFISYSNAAYVTMFSHKIIPVFLGVCMLTSTFQQEEIDYLKRFSPIGCRDMHTFRTMQKLGIPAYLNGCMTLTFPRVKSNLDDCKKIYCIDVPEEIKNNIPEKLLADCVFVSHTFYMSDLEITPEEKAKEMYTEYVENAKMVITTRMHAALPCAAAGIPVVLLKDVFSYRFAGIDKIVKIYTKEEYDTIDWKPEPINYENIKTAMLANAKEVIMDAWSKHEKQCAISSFMESRKTREEYVEFRDNTIKFIDDNWDNETEIEYVLWGVTQVAEVIHQYIHENYPNARLAGIIDKNKRIEFLGKRGVPKEEQRVNSKAYYFVCTGAAINESNTYFCENGIVNFYQCCMDGINHLQDKEEGKG